MEQGEATRKIGDVHRRGGHAPIDGDVEHMRALHDHLRQARRSAEDVGEEFEHRPMRLEQREQFRRRRHPRQRGVETRHAGIGVAGFGKRLEQARDQFGQHLAGAGAAHRGAASEMPAAHGFGGQRRVAETHVAQGLQRFGIVGRAGEDQIARARIESRRVFEQARVMFLDGMKMPQQVARKAAETSITAEAREVLERRIVIGQALGLMVVLHLQAMLDCAQIAVGVGEVVRRLRGYPVVGAELPQHVQGARAPQSRAAAAEDQLLGLDEKLDFADSATPQA